MAERETICFLHGWGIGPENYSFPIDRLSKVYHVVAPNLTDFTPSRKFSWRKFAKNFDKSINKRVFILGVSLGGGLALVFASLFPRKVNKVIVCEPAGIRIKRNKLIWGLLLLKMMARSLFYPKGPKVVSKALLNYLKELITHPKEVCWQTNFINDDLEKYSFSNTKTQIYILWSKNPDIMPSWMGERLCSKIKPTCFKPYFSDKNHLWPLFEQEKLAAEVLKIFGDKQR